MMRIANPHSMKLLAALATIFLGFSATAAEPFRMNSVMLLQPESELGARVESAASLANYIVLVQSAAAEALAGESPKPASGYLVFAVRSGGRVMVWLDFKPGLSQQAAKAFRSALLRVRGVEVRSGVIVFALNASLWGAPPSQRNPRPAEWEKAMAGRSEPMEIGSLVDLVWPESAE